MKRSLISALLLASASASFAQWPSYPRADLILGDRETMENALDGASGVAIDEPRHKIYVACADSNRVLRFDSANALANGPLVAAEAVFGQPDFNSDSLGLTATSMSQPGALAVDFTGRLWVIDRSNHRVLRFDYAYAKKTGDSADGVLGAPDFTTFGSYFSGGLDGLTVDAAGNLFVSDSANHRVCRFNSAATKPDGDKPDAALGQLDLNSTLPGLNASKLKNPGGVFATNGPATGLWVVDRGNNRVLRFDNADTASNGTAATAVLGQPDMFSNSPGSAMSRFNQPLDVVMVGSNLYVSDPGNDRTLRFPGANPPLNSSATATLRSDLVTSGGPVKMTVEPTSGRLWGTASNSLVRFDAPESGNGNVFRTAVFGDEGTFMRAIRDVAIDPATGKVFVADTGMNPRGVGRFASYAALLTGAQPEAWICKLQSSASVDEGGGLYCAFGLSIDAQGRLWVADPVTRAVYRYDNAATIGAFTVASAFLGGAAGTGANQMTGPRDVYADPQGRVWVVDSDNHRVLRFDNAAGKPNGAAANAVLGQTGFGLKVQGSTPTLSNLYFPSGIVGDGAGNIWVADRYNNRVLRFNNAAAKANGGVADSVLGQPNGTTAIGALGASGLDHPMQLAWETGGHLWISEVGNKRIMRFKNALSLGSGAPADSVIGQPDFWHNDTRKDYQHIVEPGGLAVDPLGRVYVADTEGDRMLRFSFTIPKITVCGFFLKKFRFTYLSTPGVQYDIESSDDLLLWNYEGTQTAVGATTIWTTLNPTVNHKYYRVKSK